MELPYAEPLTLREPGRRVIPEPPRRGEPGGEPCGLCGGGATAPVWEDEYFTLHPPVGGSMPGHLWLASRDHVDSFCDLSPEAAEAFGPLVARVERAILATRPKVLAVVQTFDPPGVAARTIQECLLIQLRADPNPDPVSVEIVEEHDLNGHSAAATLGIRRALELGAERVLLAAGDCPLLTAAEVDALLARHDGQGVVILADRHGIVTGDRVILTSARGAVTAPARVTETVRPDTVFMPFHWGGDGSVNRVTNDATDPVSGMPEFKVCAAAVRT